MLAFAMAAEFSAAQVAAIAALAQLELAPDEVQLFARQLGDFLGYADEVLAIDTAGVAPTAYVVTRQESERPDEVRPSLDRDAALRNAPDASLDTGFFRVPRVIG
jgi:aspartyl-tRNA(Asn)/glutamyl-tRNA(Gln) amidotransferase subunit C